jgi:hypothetical protein
MKQTQSALLRVLAGTIFLAALGTAVLLPAAQSSPQTTRFKLIRKIPLGGDGFWDYLSIDAAMRRLYISRSTHVMVVDADWHGDGRRSKNAQEDW